jgi:hypothetical protein
MSPDDLITKRDLHIFKQEFFSYIEEILGYLPAPKKWIREKQLREITGWSSSTIQNNRINGNLVYSKIGGTIFYDIECLMDSLDKNSKNTKQ